MFTAIMFVNWYVMYFASAFTLNNYSIYQLSFLAYFYLKMVKVTF